MSNCCSKANQNILETKSEENKDIQPKNFVKRLFWKIGKAENEKAKKRKQELKSCCSMDSIY